MPNNRTPVVERFWFRVEKTETCWLWRGYTNEAGYGIIIEKNKHRRLTHRFSWELHNGPIPGGLCVLHRCDTPACVNPAHLFLGTHSDNHADMVNKGRHQHGDGHYRRLDPSRGLYGDANPSRQHPERLAHGENHVNARLTWEQVRSIRREYAAGGTSLRRLAEDHGVAISTVHHVVRGRIWREPA